MQTSVNREETNPVIACFKSPPTIPSFLQKITKYHVQSSAFSQKVRWISHMKFPLETLKTGHATLHVV